MKVKVGNRIYAGEVEPVMVILAEEDKANITLMADDAFCYCSYPANMSPEAAKEWMHKEGSGVAGGFIAEGDAVRKLEGAMKEKTREEK